MKHRITIRVTTLNDSIYVTGATWVFDGPVTEEAIKEAELELTQLQNVKRTFIMSWSKFDE